MVTRLDETTRIENARKFAETLQQALREEGSGGAERWRIAVEEGLTAAYAAGDVVAVCEVVQVIISLLDAQGRYRDAVSEVGHAIALADDEPNALAMLNSMSATLLAACGDVEAARRSIGAAELAMSGSDIPFAIAKCRANCAMARLLLLEPDAADAIGLGLKVPTDARAADALFLMSYIVPYQFARGARADARPWLRTFRLQATAASHAYRLADARIFEAAEAAIAAPLEPMDAGDIPRWHWLANWRAEVLRFRQHLLRRDWVASEASLTLLARARRRAGDAQLDDFDGFEMLLSALLDRTLPGCSEAPPTQVVHLFNLPSLLAAAEAVAMGGSPHSASAWYQWLDSNLPPSITTSLEWPVSRWRIQALLALRAGHERVARRDFERAVQWATDAAYPIELAVTQIQLAELLFHQNRGAELTRRELRDQGSDSLRAAGLEPTIFAYAVARIVPSRGGSGLAMRLTPRETQALGYLADGLTYRAAAELMGVKWTTVQTLAHRCYEKLDASGRQAAVARARELGVL